MADYKENLDLACEKFRKILEGQLKRIEDMKSQGDFTDYAAIDTIKIGVCGGDGNGTDCPVELPFALGGIQCAVTRKTLKGKGPYLPHEAFTIQEALDSYTYWGAYSSFEENVKGRIEVGMMADFVILGGNPFETDESAIKDIPVCATFLSGKQVYKA